MRGEGGGYLATKHCSPLICNPRRNLTHTHTHTLTVTHYRAATNTDSGSSYSPGLSDAHHIPIPSPVGLMQVLRNLVRKNENMKY